MAVSVIFDHLARLRVRQEQVDREEISFGEEHDLRSVRAQFGARVEAAPLVVDDHRPRERTRHLRHLGDRFVGGELRLVPELGQLFLFDAENLLKRALDAVASQRLTEHVADDPSPHFADEGPDGLTVAVGK